MKAPAWLVSALALACSRPTLAVLCGSAKIAPQSLHGAIRLASQLTEPQTKVTAEKLTEGFEVRRQHRLGRFEKTRRTVLLAVVLRVRGRDIHDKVKSIFNFRDQLTVYVSMAEAWKRIVSGVKRTDKDKDKVDADALFEEFKSLAIVTRISVYDALRRPSDWFTDQLKIIHQKIEESLKTLTGLQTKHDERKRPCFVAKTNLEDLPSRGEKLRRAVMLEIVQRVRGSEIRQIVEDTIDKREDAKQFLSAASNLFKTKASKFPTPVAKIRSTAVLNKLRESVREHRISFSRSMGASRAELVKERDDVKKVFIDARVAPIKILMHASLRTGEGDERWADGRREGKGDEEE